MVIRRMARDLDLPVKIFAGKTVREDDGLALSSRNAYLDAEQRRAAPLLHQVLRDIAEKMSNGEDAAKALRAGKAKLGRAGFRVDYLQARNADTLEPLAGPEPGPARLLVAAWLGTTRLIDNLPVGKPRA
jgi:pantoate--beta-alanine ligase